MKKIFLMILVAAALVGCAKSEMSPAPDDKGVEIALCSATVDASADASGLITRAPFEGAIGTSNTLEARVIASLVSSFASTPYVNGIMIFKGSVATNYEAGFSGTSTFPDSTNPVHLFGLYPASWTYTNGGVADYTFTGKEDVMATEKISTKQQDVVDGTYQTLSFKHLLTRLEVKLSAAAPAITALGNVTSIKLIGDKTAGTTAVNNKVTVNNNGAALTTAFSSTGVTSLDFYGLTLGADSKKAYANAAVSAYTLTTVPTFVGYSMVAPVTATSANVEEYFLEVTTANGGIKRIPVDLKNGSGADFEGNTAGRVFIVSIFFKSIQEISVDVEVADWVEEGEYQGEVAV